jgi:peptide/nickel transport system substrate-binding protein
MLMLLRRVLGACLAVLLFAGVPSPDALAQMREELRIGVAGVPAVLDPMAGVEGAIPLIARQVFDTLVAYREGTTDIEPALATRWTVSRDGLTWRFTLREGVRFHDGAPLAAADVVASLERHLQPDPPSAVWPALLRGLPGVVRGMRAVDAKTLELTLVQPYAPLLTVLAHPGFGVVRALTGTDGATRLVGTGPFQVVEASPGRLALERVPGHWAGEPRPPRIVFLEVASDDHAEAEFDAGALDIWFPQAPPRRTDWALSVPGLRVGYLAFQTEKEPFSRKPVRQAIAAAIDPATLGAALGRAAVPLQSFLPPGTWARREGSPVLGGTREAVRGLLAAGDWPQGYAPVMVAAEETGAVDSRAVATALRKMLGAADVPIQVRFAPLAAVRAALEAGEHELALVEMTVAGGDPHLLLFPLSTSEGATKGPQAMNYSFYRNPRLDDVLIRASQLSFRPERAKLYRRAQGLLAEEVPWLPLYVRLVWGVARPDVRELRLHPTGFHRLSTIGLAPGLLR